MRAVVVSAGSIFIVNAGIVGKLLLAAVLAFFYLGFLTTDNYFSPVDHVNLAFHEGGHVVFGFFGQFIMTAGGTLMQLLLPAACLLHFRRQGSELGVQLSLWWLGENLLNISIYIADARQQVLPLVAGGVHDWTYLLEKVGLLAHNEGVARLVFLLGSLLTLYSTYLVAGLPRPWQCPVSDLPIVGTKQ